MFIRTERLFLRPCWPEDMSELLEVLREDSDVRSIGVSDFPRSAGALRAYMARPWDPLLPHFLINLRDESGASLIGGIGLSRSEKDVELGCWLAGQYRGRGYAAEAVRAVLAEARMLGHREIVARQFAGNEALAKALENSGFRLMSEARARLSAAVGAEARARLYVATLADKLFDLMGVGPMRAAPA